MRVDSYEFGKIVIEGRPYTQDVLVFSARVLSPWMRKAGHSMAKEDLGSVWMANPEVLVVGTGAGACMRVLPETLKELKEKGIECILEPTGQACTTYNRLSETRQVVGAFHLTC